MPLLFGEGMHKSIVILFNVMFVSKMNGDYKEILIKGKNDIISFE